MGKGEIKESVLIKKTKRIEGWRAEQDSKKVIDLWWSQKSMLKVTICAEKRSTSM
jgi:hypothetical protein